MNDYEARIRVLEMEVQRLKELLSDLRNRIERALQANQ